MSKQGVVYACSDIRWMEETVQSARSVAKVMPHLEREFYAPGQLISSFSIPAQTFTKIVPLAATKVQHRPRFESFLMTGLERAVFLDGDTMLIRPMPEVFDLLEHFDLGLTIAPQLHGTLGLSSAVLDTLPRVSLALPEYNGGFILAKVNERFRTFVRQWLHYFEKCIAVGVTLDQPALRVAAALSDLRIAVLPSNYNFRANVPQVVKGEVKVLHAHADLVAIEQFINQKTNVRLYEPSEKLVHGFKPKAFLDWKAAQSKV